MLLFITLKKPTTILSDFDGYLNLSEFKKSDTITFSHVAYEKLQIPVNKILQSDTDVYDVYLILVPKRCLKLFYL